jgi:hypothetical protein
MNLRIGDAVARNRSVLLLALVTGLILLVPLVATRLSDAVTWTLFDFVAMGALLFGGGLVFVLAARRTATHRLAVGATILAAVLFLWVEMAVGVFTDLGS